MHVFIYQYNKIIGKIFEFKVNIYKQFNSNLKKK